jgi:hypothetical protein
MKAFIAFCLIVCVVGGCTTLQPVTGSPAAVQQRISSGALLKPGDDVLIRTEDGRTYYFNVTSVNASTIEGRHESILIDQIASIEKRKLSVGKTALAAVGLTVVVAAAVVVVAVYTVGGYRSSGGRASWHSGRFAQPVPPPLLTPLQNSQLQSCDGSSGESKGQEDSGGSAHVHRCAT